MTDRAALLGSATDGKRKEGIAAGPYERIDAIKSLGLAIESPIR